MESLTKRELNGGEIAALVQAMFGAGTRVIAAKSVTEGWYNAGYALELAGSGPARTFLKVAPPASVPVLTYEHRLMRSEVAALEALAHAEVPHIPAVLATDFSKSVVESDCLFMAWVDGVMLTDAYPAMSESERVRVRRQIGEVCGLANRIEGKSFGYAAQPTLQGTDWRSTFLRMIDGLIADAVRFEAPLAKTTRALAEDFERGAALLDGDYAPRLTHFDLWDKNVLVRQNADGWELSGIVDWERGFYGDPLADLISLTLRGSAAEREAVIAGQAAGLGEPLATGETAHRRLALYRAYLWLIMIVEAGPRGFGGSIRLPTSSAAQRLYRDLAIAAG